MKKSKNMFKYFAAAMGVVATGVTGALLPTTSQQSADQVASAAFSSYAEVQNNLPAYLNVNGLYGNDIKNIFLLDSSASSLSLQIGKDQQISNPNDTNKKNPAYYTETVTEGQLPSSYYYFDFKTNISLYKDISNVQVQAGITSENILTGQPLNKYTADGQFAVNEGAMVPKSLNINFKLNTEGKNISFNDSTITLNEEGCYTLVIPAFVYYTENSGATYTLLNQQETNIYYTFMVFDSTTYFKGSGTQNVDFSTNLQPSSVNSSTYSQYYFYNYSKALAGVDPKDIAQSASVNTLPHLTYKHQFFKVNVKYTDVENDTFFYHIEYQNGNIVVLNENGNELTSSLPIETTLLAGSNQTKVTFTQLGEYELSFDYLYIVEHNGQTTTYALPLQENITSDRFQNKKQKVYVYGYQAMFSDYENVDPSTNQPSDSELKTISINETESRFNKSADITSQVNTYVKSTAGNGWNIPGVATGGDAISSAISNNSASYTLFNFQRDNNINEDKGVAGAALAYINAAEISPVSTNQPPIKFITNATQKANSTDSLNSIIYKVTGSAGNYNFTESSVFEGFNQNTPGTYCYIIQYTYDYYMTTGATLQAAYNHYQIFFFEITNTIPSVTVLAAEKDDDDKYISFTEIYTRGFTNKDVFILNNAKNNDYDAAVTITLDAYNYNNGTYFFRDLPLDNLVGVDQNLQYTPHTEDFDNNSTTQDDGRTDGKETKYGVLIKNTAAYANAKYTIKIKSATTTEPSVQTFTIDNQEISGTRANNANKTSSTYYTLADGVQESGITNRPIAMSWNEKTSGAKTYGYLKHIPFSAIDSDFYPTTSFDLTSTLGELLEPTINMLPVYSKLDLDKISDWGQYANSNEHTNTLPASNVRSENGIYILQVYDQAGNYTFKVFMIDNTSPIFVQSTRGEQTSFEFIKNSSNISVPAEGTDVFIHWAKYKGIYIGKDNILDDNESYNGYQYSGINNASFEETLNKFFSDNTKQINGMTREEMHGHYFLSEIKDVVYVKDRASSYAAQTNPDHTFHINFFETINGQKEANEGTVKIIVRDSSNGYIFDDEYYAYLNYPSSYISFNITSDLSQFTIYQEVNGEKENLEGESYSHIADLYYKDANYTGDLTTDSNYSANPSGFRTKYSFRPALKTINPLFVSYIPVLKGGTTLSQVDVKYYPYETAKTESIKNGDEQAYYYYKDVAKTPQISLTLFKYDKSATYTEEEVYSNPLAFGQDNKPLAGKYVLTRQYRIAADPTTAADDYKSEATALASKLDKAYDFFNREITFYVDNYGIITSLESVTTTNASGGETHTGLESIVGGDIVINMHSSIGAGKSDISISFPTYKENGLNSGSLFTQTTFDKNNANELVKISLETNKLPLAFYIPTYKYTISSEKQANNSFKLSVNDYLSYFGDVEIFQNDDKNWQIALNGKLSGTVLPNLFESDQAAYNYLYSDMSISEYELSAEIRFVDANRNETYYSTKRIDGTAHYETTDDGYLALYKRPEGFGGTSYGDKVTDSTFTGVGTYYVTLYQGANDPTSNIYDVYKFAIEVTSAQPEFQVLDFDTKTELSSVYTTEDGVDVIYTNARNLRVQWEDEEDQYKAKIDQTAIYYGVNGTDNHYTDEIHNIAGTNTYYFDIPTPYDDLISNPDYLKNGIQIELQFENHGNWYSKAKKRVIFDIEAPTATLEYLMDKTAASAPYLTTNYQKQSMMRQYIDYAGNVFDPTDSNNEGRSASYIYNVNNGVYAYYAFTVDTSFFTGLKESFYNSDELKPIDGTNISEVYFNKISDLKTYNQSDKSTYLDSFEALSNTDVEHQLVDATDEGYYEIIETDWAGNRTIYVVYLKNPTTIAEENLAIEYVDGKTPAGDTECVYDDQVNTNKFNIYANTGFEIQSLGFNQDPWLYFTIRNKGVTTHYLKSPRLTDENQIYKLAIQNGNLTATIVNLQEISKITESSQAKNLITLADRTNGFARDVLLTVMDSSLVVEKLTENVAEDTASIAINIPSSQQVASEKTGYVYPVKVEVYTHDTLDKLNPWKTFASFEQLSYNTWTPTKDSDPNNSQYVTFTEQASTYLNRLVVSAKAGINERVRFVITDNFGNESTLISFTGNVLTEEISTTAARLYTLEDSEGRTYLSNQTITYKYNSQLYTVEIKIGDLTEGLANAKTETNNQTKISTITFKQDPNAKYCNGYYIVNVYDAISTETDLVKTFYVRLYNKLPQTLLEANADANTGIIFLDKKLQNIGSDNIKLDTDAKPLYLNVEMDGTTYAGAATTVTTYSRNVTVRFPNGLSLANSYSNNYKKGFTYSAYISSDDGLTWQNIDNLDPTQSVTTYTISGVGRYLMIIKYNDDEILTDNFKLYEVNILDASSSYYYITVNGQHVDKSTGIKYSYNKAEYETTYIVSLEYADRKNSLAIHKNEELQVEYKKINTIYLGTNSTDENFYPDVPTGTIVTEIYSYWCDEAKGDFVIIYIPQSSNIAGTISYELPSGETESLKDGLDKFVVADKDTAPNFNKLKISYTSYYGVEQNKITPIVYKLLDGKPVALNIMPYKSSDTLSYIYLEMSGTYYLQMVDSCTPANSQIFNGKRLNGYEYVEITFLSNVPFEVTTTDKDGNEYTTAPIQKAIYNSQVTLSLSKVADYYLPSAELTITATKNGAAYEIAGVGNTYTFTEPGYYTVKFSATSSTGILVREETFSFTIINPNESRYAFEFSEYGNYYIEKILKDGVDITQQLLKISNFKTTIVNGKTYLSSITLNHLDEKTGKGRYEITVNLNNTVYAPVVGESFTFGLWINLAKPPIHVSVNEGTATTNVIQVYFNPQALYTAVGDCYLQIGSAKYEYTSENIQSAGEGTTLNITNPGTYFIQVYTQSGHLLYSFKVTKNEPLNSFAIIAIVLGVVALGAIIFITVKLRKRQKVK